MMSHNERCKECKVKIQQLLEKIYGPVIPNYRIQVGTRPEELREHPRYPILNDIYSALQKHRGFSEFVRAGYVDVDFFLPEQKMIVEFDESQHFTIPRKIVLFHYPSDLPLGFPRDAWTKHCDEIHAYDNDPPFRDEQRAWYDTLRDFIPEMKGFRPTVRLYAKEMMWCTLDSAKKEDVDIFRKILASEASKPVIDEGAIPLNPSPREHPELDAIIRFEYLANSLKLQYLSDCTTGRFEYNSPYLNEHKEKTQILNSGGAGFKVYLNRPFRGREKGKSKLGPLFSDRDPWDYTCVKELQTVNNELQNFISGSEDWFELFCEYTLVKTSLHEIISDIHDPENKNKYGFPDLMNIHEIEKETSISGAKLRNFVINCLNIGINPSENRDGSYQDVDHLSGCKYAEFQARRKEWINFAWYLINRIKERKSLDNLPSVVQWHISALCAYETGPVFIRKERDFLLPRIARSFETYNKWDQEWLKENLHEIVERDVIILIDSYWDEFKGQQTVEFYEGNRSLATKIKDLQKVCDEHYEEMAPLQKYHQQSSINAPTNSMKAKAQYSGGTSSLYRHLLQELDPLFGKIVKPQKTKLTYRAMNEIGYPNKTELDMISIFKPTQNAVQIRFRIYPHILASHLGLHNADEIIKTLPERTKVKQERDNPHLGDIFLEGAFSNEEEIEIFLKWILFGKDQKNPV